MHGADPNTWPADFDTLAQSPPSGWTILQTVLDPILLIRRQGDRLIALLAARLARRQGEVLLAAPSRDCNWVCGDGLICPLPKDVASFVQKTLTGMRADALTFPQALALQRAPLEVVQVEFDEDVLVPANDAASRETKVNIPGLNAKPFPYQAHGIAWMHAALRRTGGVILADEMGLGKTLQIIGLLLIDPPARESPALVICPTTLIANWIRELARFAPSLEVALHRGPDRARLHRDLMRSQVVITTYDTLVNDLVLFQAITWSWVICDEAQAVKNPDAQRRMAVSVLDRRWTIPVTGTPMENHLMDLWSLLDIAVPGLLGDRESFERRYPDDETAARKLATETSPFILRRRVRDVAQDLPPRMDVPVPLELGSMLAERYEQVRSETLANYPRAGAMVATGQLQLFCAHPELVANDTASTGWEDRVALATSRSPVITPKLERTIELLAEAFANRRKVLLFANFNACGAIIEQAAAGLPGAFWGAINGATPAGRRQEIVDEFSNYDGPGVLVLNPRAAGAGLNITAATVVIHFTQVWNPALELQATARAHRRGQTEPVTIYYLYYVDTVEQVMLERAQRRRELGDEAVPTTEQETADLDRALTLSPVQTR